MTTVEAVQGLIPDYYKGRSIFITGASGLMGKVLIERLLYYCCEIEKIYILVRPKRGKSVDTRIDEMMKLPVSCSSNLSRVNHHIKFLAFLPRPRRKTRNV